MDFKAVTMVTVLALLATVMQGRKLERDALPRATCTAPMATKGETAVVTCHYPLEVKQPGEIVSVSVERYPFTSSNTDVESILECDWDGNFTCTLDKEEHRVEGKDVVITIRNVNKDNQGRYLCKMMVKDGPNIHGVPCQLLVNGTDPSDPLPSTTDPALDQPTTRNNDTISEAQMEAETIPIIVVVCVSVLVIVAGAAVFVWKKRRNAARQREKAQNGETEQHRLSEMENGGASGHDSTEGSLGSAEDPSKKTVQEKIRLFKEKERNETASSRPQFRPRTGELKRTEKETEIEENQQDAKKKEDEEKEMEMREEKKEDEEEDEQEEKEEEEKEAKVTDEQKQVEEKKEDEENEEDKEEKDKEKEEDKEDDVDEEDEEEEEKAAIRWLLGDQSQTQSVDIAADPESLECEKPGHADTRMC